MLGIASERLRRPRWTLRLRLTLLYGALFLIAGAVLLAITYGLVAHNTATVSLQGKRALVVSGRGVSAPLPPPTLRSFKFDNVTAGPGAAQVTIKKITAVQRAQLESFAARARKQLDHQRSATLDALLTKSGIALAIMALASIGLGWLMAGRALRPVRTMSMRARGISERTLHERLALSGPDDELKELGDTFDALLGRLESAFDSQRRFVANASHELRTPITLSRTLAEVALADPGASVESLRATCQRVIAVGEQQERLIEALLTLARSQRGLAERAQLDLAPIVAEAVRAAPVDGIRVQEDLGTAWTNGDPSLVERLAANLVENAVRHNHARGWIRARTDGRNGLAVLEVENSGPVVPAEGVATLVEPFRRLNGDRDADAPGLGLGLSIVQAIAQAHDASFELRPRAGGGLVARVGFRVLST